MPLEKDVQDLTSAINKLIAVLTPASVGTAAQAIVASQPTAPAVVAETTAKAEATAAKAEATAAPPANTNAAAAVPYEAVRDAVVALAGAKGKDAALAIIQKFGVASAKDLPTDKYAEAIAALQAAA
jgi:hypothetical protein